MTIFCGLREPHRVAEQMQDGLYDLSGSQRLIWTGQRLQPDQPLYNMVLVFEIEGVVEVPAFRRAFGRLVESCDILRCQIVLDGDTPRQKFSDTAPKTLTCLDFSADPDPGDRLAQWIDTHRVHNFALDESLFESALIKISDERFVWYLNQHHIATDASSSAILFEKMQHLYGLALDGRLDESRPLPDYRDYLALERNARSTPHYQRSEKYWKSKLGGTHTASIFYRQIPVEHTGRTQRTPCPLGESRSRRIAELAEQTGFRTLNSDLSRFQIFATAVFAYLFRITGNHRISIGTPAHNRVSPELRQTAGLFIELFPIDCQIDPGETFTSLHRKVAGDTQQFLIHTAPGLSSSAHNRSYDVVLNYITSSFGDFNGMPARCKWIHSGFGDRSHLLRLQVHDFDRSGSVDLDFDTNVDAFAEDERVRAVGHFLKLFDAFLDDPGQAIAAVPLLSEHEYQRLIVEYNDQPATRIIDATLVEQFQRQALRSAQHTALVCGTRSIDYSTLETLTCQWAGYLNELGIGPGDRVALYLTRSISAVVAIWGILRSGAAYIPLDIEHPTPRTAAVLRDGDPSLILTQSKLVGRLPAEGHRRICMDLVEEEVCSRAPDHGLNRAIPLGIAYIIYTSGSTGRPKGVVVNHRSLANYVTWARDYYLEGESLDFPLFSSLAFDLTVTSIFTSLISGGRLLIYPERSDGREIAIQRVIQDNEVDIVKLTPSHLSLFRAFDLSGSRIKKLIVGGEDLKADLALAISRRFGGRVEIYNEYGPTEGTVACMIYRFDPLLDTAGSVPIGRSIGNLEVYILDGCGNPSPQGVIGEIFIGGAGVANGYLNDQHQTERHFVANPFRPGETMYASGDLARWTPEGELQFLGRQDHQVKIRGVRVELAEIEKALTGQHGIDECVVTALDRSGGRQESDTDDYCVVCGLSGRHPDAHLDEQKTCRICRTYQASPDKAHGYFGEMKDLHRVIERIKAEKQGEHDCIMLLSGGKDSSYVLCKLVDMGLNPLVFTMDNGYISDGAKANIRRLVDDLGLELHVGQTPYMNEVFVDSLHRYSNVCNGCFKVIYTLSMNLAHQRGIRYIITGLSRGQIFETRLADLFRNRIFDGEAIDRTIIEARKAYHRLDDVVSRNMDVEIFQSDGIFEEIQFIDFYRYCNVTLDEVLNYLDQKAGWIRPADTGRSTNCLINEVGIHVHKQEQGYHNYALPYSWDVRLGHKERDAAREELDDDINLQNVERILGEIGYQANTFDPTPVRDKQLVAYYTAAREALVSELRSMLSSSLPDAFIPSAFIHMEEFPLNANGKLDRAALPLPDLQQQELCGEYIPPRGETERRLAALWAQTLGLEQVGRMDNFFDLGGDSILNIQIVAGARKLGLSITPQQIFDHPTVAELTAVAQRIRVSHPEQGAIQGPMELTPIQKRFFQSDRPDPGHFSQSVMLELDAVVDPSLLERAFVHLVTHHDGLRSRFEKSGHIWKQHISGADIPPLSIRRHDLRELSATDLSQRIEGISQELQAGLNLATGSLIQVGFLQRDSEPNLLIIVIHHLVVDGVSWWILLQDLDRICGQIHAGEQVRLPPKSASVRTWARALGEYSRSTELRKELDFWLSSSSPGIPLPRDYHDRGENDLTTAREVHARLDAETSRRLLFQVPAVYRVQIMDLLLSALSLTLSQWCGGKELRLDVEGHGREEILPGLDLLRTVGWFTSIYPVRLQCKPGTDPGQALHSIKEQLRAIPKRGVGYGILRYMNSDSAPARRLAGLPPREVLFNYMGRWDRTPAGAGWVKLAGPIQGSFGTQGPRSHLIEINAVVFDGRLQFDWTYSSCLHRQETVQKLADDCMFRIQSLVDHCLSSRDGGLTPSDFPDADLSQGGLDALLAEFGES